MVHGIMVCYVCCAILYILYYAVQFQDQCSFSNIAYCIFYVILYFYTNTILYDTLLCYTMLYCMINTLIE